MFFTFVASVIAAFLRFLFLLEDFFVKIWLLYALFLFNCPVPVFLKRFAAALFVFIFGIVYVPPYLYIYLYTALSSFYSAGTCRTLLTRNALMNVSPLKTSRCFCLLLSKASLQQRYLPAPLRNHPGYGGWHSYAPSHVRGTAM